MFALTISGFIAILLVSRFQSIARFATTGASPFLILQFAAIQIPRILPLAIPISCLISSFILFDRMNHSSCALTALRANGMGLTTLCFPLMLSGVIIALCNFIMISEISPRCRSHSKALLQKMAIVNPLSLIQKGSPLKLETIYADATLSASSTDAIGELCCIVHHPTSQRLDLILAKELTLTGDRLIGKGVTCISSIPPKTPDAFDHLIIENQGEMRTDISALSQYVTGDHQSLSYNCLSYRMMRAKTAIEAANGQKKNPQAVQECARRLSLGIAPLAFILVGIACAAEPSRAQNSKKALWAAALMAIYLITFIAAKSLRHFPHLSLILFAFPYPLLYLFCLRSFRKLSRGSVT